jgi:hypothetical protein
MHSVTFPLLLLFPPVGQPPVAEDVAAVEKAALANRQAVRTAYVVLRRDYRSHKDPADNRKAEATIWMDGDRLRTDHVDHYPGLGDQAGRRYIECFNCERPGHHLTYPEVPHVVGRLEPVPGGKFESVRATIDPRLIGYVPVTYGVLWHFRLDSYIGRADRSDPQLTREALNGVDCRVVRYTFVQGKVQVAIWFDPKRGHHPLRIVHAENGFRMAVDVEPQPAGNGLWYPKTVRFTEHVGGKLAIEEVVEVTEVRLNEPIPADTFMLRGMGIADGTHFSVYGTKPTERSWVWTGGQLVPLAKLEAERERREGVPNPEPVPLVSTARPRYWLYAVAAGLVVAAVPFLRRAARSRPA